MKSEYDIVIRKVPGKGFVGLYVIKHKEVYCTSGWYRSPEDALQAVLDHINDEAEHDGMIS